MDNKRMQGVVIAAITPMNQDGSIDYKGVEDFAEYLVQSGVNCLYPNGTNGESLLLTKEEREKIAIDSDSEFARKIDGKRQEDVWPVLDELMEIIKGMYPRLYNAVLAKL